MHAPKRFLLPNGNTYMKGGQKGANTRRPSTKKKKKKHGRRTGFLHLGSRLCRKKAPTRGSAEEKKHRRSSRAKWVGRAGEKKPVIRGRTECSLPEGGAKRGRRKAGLGEKN